jgi:hypothetical protein
MQVKKTITLSKELEKWGGRPHYISTLLKYNVVTGKIKVFP